MAVRGGGGPSIRLSSATVAEDAEVGDLVGTLSVANGSGTYAFTLTNDAGGLFALDGVDDTLLEVAGALEATVSHQITVSADNGVDDPIVRTFTITVTASGDAILWDDADPMLWDDADQITWG